MGGQEVQEEVQQAVLRLVPRQGDAGWSEKRDRVSIKREIKKILMSQEWNCTQKLQYLQKDAEVT